MGKKKNYYFKALTWLLPVSCFIFGFSFINVYASSSVVDEFSVTVPESCSLTNTIGTAHSATIENGVYTDDVGETTINAFCNDAEGFAVYAVGFTNDEFGNNTMKPSTLDSANAIASGLATSGTTSNWAMKLTSLSDNYTLTNDFGSYHIVPDEYIKVATYPSNTTTTAGVNIKSTYAAYISQQQPADSYTGKVKYTIVHPSNADTPLRITIDDLTYLQDFNTLSVEEKEIIPLSMKDSHTYNLIDARDNKTYQIAKMKDGNIWLTENLDLGRTELTTDLTSENTNLETTIPASTFNGWYSTERFSSETNGQFAYLDGTDEYSNTALGTLYNYCTATAGTVCVSGSNDTDAEYDICPAGWRMPSIIQYRNLYKQYNSYELMRSPIISGGAAFARAERDMSTGSDGWYWSSSAWGGSMVMLMDISSSSISTGYNAGRQHGSSMRCIAKNPVHSLTISYGTGISSITINGETVPNNTTITGERNSEYKINAIPEARYAFNEWSVSSGAIKEQKDQYTTFTIGSSDATMTASATYIETEMQNLNTSSCTTTPTSVYDNRDGHTYTVQQLLDGNCWMIENLDLGRTTLTTDLTSANTNISSTITSSTFNSWYAPNSSQSDGQFSYDNNGDPVAGITLGTYYNYYAATAGANLGESNTDDATQDICPAGWRLPTGGEYGETNNLVKKYGSLESIRKSKNDGGAAFPLYIAEKSSNNYSYFWSSTAKDDNLRYTIELDAGYNTVDGKYYAYRSTKRFVRCVIKRPTRNITISYGNGISSVSVNGNPVASGTTITVEQNHPLEVGATLENRYAINTWSATSGTIDAPSSKYTNYYAGPSDTTLSVTATYVNTEMQNLSAASCTTTPSNVYDNRDNHVYIIQRLKDGKCWMMENLDLGRTTLTTDLTSSNTNLSSTVTASTFNDWKKTTLNDSTYTYNNGVFYSEDGLDPENHMPLGTLYNYYAVSAGTITGNSTDSDALYDICPAGWRLPTSDASGDYETLYNHYNSYKLLTAPISENGAAFASTGYFYRRLNTGGYQIYWSSTHYNSNEMYVLLFTSYYIYPSTNWERNHGFPVRCVLK